MNAIILAAGLGSRLFPITQNIPKPLLEINGIPIIEQQLRFLQEIDIKEIFIVVGYKSIYFEYLEHQYGVRLLHNPHYADYNNLYSIYLCREYLKDSYIIEGDSFMHRNFLVPELHKSTYFTGTKKKLNGEWLLKFHHEELSEIIIYDDHPERAFNDGYVMSGISFWSKSDAATIKKAIEKIIDGEGNFLDQSYKHKYWDHIIYENLEKLSIQVKIISPSDWTEIDAEPDLEECRARLISIEE